MLASLKHRHHELAMIALVIGVGVGLWSTSPPRTSDLAQCFQRWSYVLSAHEDGALVLWDVERQERETLAAETECNT